jgi:hypothetical protein
LDFANVKSAEADFQGGDWFCSAFVNLAGGKAEASLGTPKWGMI